MELVRDLAQVGRDDRGLVGGKAANLGELIRAGLPVPPGFVVTTDAYWAFVEVNADVRAALRRGAAGEQTRDAFESGDVPGPVRDQVAAAYEAR